MLRSLTFPPIPVAEKSWKYASFDFSSFLFFCLVIDNWFLWMFTNHVILKCSNLFSKQRSNDIKYCSFFFLLPNPLKGSSKGQKRRIHFVEFNFTQRQQYIILYSLLILVKPRTDVWLECFCYFSHVSDERKALVYVSCHFCHWKCEHTSYQLLQGFSLTSWQPVQSDGACPGNPSLLGPILVCDPHSLCRFADFKASNIIIISCFGTPYVHKTSLRYFCISAFTFMYGWKNGWETWISKVWTHGHKLPFVSFSTLGE